jgi:hypothetical protein
MAKGVCDGFFMECLLLVMRPKRQGRTGTVGSLGSLKCLVMDISGFVRIAAIEAAH